MISNDLKGIYIKEKTRYESKGYGLIAALLLALGFFVGIPKLAPKLWPLVLEFKEKHGLSYYWFYMGWSALQNTTLILNGGHLICWFLYRNEFPCIERYKSD
jgi:hypothetical protein